MGIDRTKHYQMAWLYWALALFCIFWLPSYINAAVWVPIALCVANVILHFAATPPTTNSEKG